MIFDIVNVALNGHMVYWEAQEPPAQKGQMKKCEKNYKALWENWLALKDWLAHSFFDISSNTPGHKETWIETAQDRLWHSNSMFP